MKSGVARKEALKRFREGYNCAEAALMGVARAFRIRSPLIPRVATGLGGGIGRHGLVCGALTGAVMGLALKYGRDRPEDSRSREEMYRRADRLVREFEKKYGTSLCRKLTGVNMLTDRGRKEAARRRLHADLCPRFVAFAAARAVKRE